MGSFRACVITTWIALVYDIIDKLRELALAGDAKAKEKVIEFEDIQKNRDTNAALSFERDVLKMAKDDFEFLTAQEQADLFRLFDDRNRCGHPNLIREDEIYSPPPELARLHLRNVVEYVLSRPPVQGKAGLDYIKKTVDSEYFPENETDALSVLSATAILRAKKNLIKEFVLGALTSIMRETVPEQMTVKKWRQRLAAVLAIEKLHTEIVHAILKEKFDECVMHTNDKCLLNVVQLLNRVPEFCSYVKEPTWTKLKTYVKNIPKSEILFIFSALEIDALKLYANERLAGATYDEILSCINYLESIRQDIPIEVIEKCIDIYKRSISYDDANSKYRTIICPIFKNINKESAKKLIESGKKSQVKDSFEFPNLIFKLRSLPLLDEQEFKMELEKNDLLEKFSYFYKVETTGD